MPDKDKNKRWIALLPIYGCFSTGIIYAAVGVIAILSFLKIKHGGADESSLLAFLNDYVAGRILIWVILLGTISYITWRIYETIKDPYGYGTSPKGIATRTGIALSTVADMLIAYTAIMSLLGKSHVPENGQPEAQRQMVHMILQKSWGDAAVICTGAIVAITAVVQLLYGVTNGYKERINIGSLHAVEKHLIRSLAWMGYAARGIILGIVGFFLIKAGILENEQYVVNTDKAFDFIGDHIGHLYFILVAVGTICYGLFMFALGTYYDPDKG
jgi:hypothetical protein